MRRILIIGVDGVIGSDLARYFSIEGFVVVGTSRRPEASESRLYLDLANVDVESFILPDVDFAVFAGAMTRFSDCRASPYRAHRINVEAPARLAERLARLGVRNILLSTAAVFDGSSPYVLCSTPTSAVSVYGRLKAEAERAFLALGSFGSVIRLTKVFAPNYPLIDNWALSLREGHRVDAFSDLKLAPISLEDVRAGVLAAMRLGGIVQVSGQQDVSYFELLVHIVQRLNKDLGLVHSVTAENRGIPVSERPNYTTLDTSMLERFAGWRPPDPFALVDKLYLNS